MKKVLFSIVASFILVSCEQADGPREYDVYNIECQYPNGDIKTFKGYGRVYIDDDGTWFYDSIDTMYRGSNYMTKISNRVSCISEYVGREMEYRGE